MSDPKPNSNFATALAAFLAGAGLGAGTTITVSGPADVPDAGSEWRCEILANQQVFCAPHIPPPACVCDTADAGTEQDGG